MRTLQGTAREILTDRFGLLRMLSAMGPIWRCVTIDPKPFFGTIGSEGRIRLGNALAFFTISLTLYAVIQLLFEQFLISRDTSPSTRCFTTRRRSPSKDTRLLTRSGLGWQRSPRFF
jgi:hypothetical protein